MKIDALRSQLETIEEELAGLGDRRSALETAAADLRQAISSVEALEGDASTSRSSSSRRKRSSTPKPARPTVTPDDLTGAISDLGGEATVEQLVEKLGLPDGRSLNGARRIAVEAGTVEYADRTYRLAS